MAAPKRTFYPIDVVAALGIHLGELNIRSENAMKLMEEVAEALDDVNESNVPGEVRSKLQSAKEYLESHKKSNNACDSINKQFEDIPSVKP